MIEMKCVRSGQVRAYCDTVYEFEVKSDEGFEATKAHCLREHPCENETERELDCFGNCGFPFGLNPFFWFGNRGPNEFCFKIVQPYCD
jgi:hypothetical protein